MGPEHVPLSCLGEVVLTNVNFRVFFEMGPEHVPLSCVGQVDFYNCAVFEIWALSTSRYPVSRKLFLQLQQTGVSEIFLVKHHGNCHGFA